MRAREWRYSVRGSAGVPAKIWPGPVTRLAGVDAGLAAEDDAGADVDVVAEADLAGDDDVVVDGAGAGEADLRGDDDVLADDAVVADVDEVVDLCAVANPSLA